MSERLVTEADLEDTVCECGHLFFAHRFGRCGVDFGTRDCDCKRSSLDLRLDDLDAVVRREVAKSLTEAIERIESLAGDYVNGGHTLSWQGARHCVESLLAENGGQS